MEKRIDDIFALWRDSKGPGGQVLVTYKGKTLFEKCYGCADLETGAPITPHTVFQLASVSKLMTAMAILMLSQQGKVNVDDDVRCYVPEYINFSEPVTVRQLMDHTSGIRCHYGLRFLQGLTNQDSMSFSETLRCISQQKSLSHAPGEQFLYSNPNYILMAAIVEKLTGQKFPAWAKENIFRPLGMENTSIPADFTAIQPGFARSYSDNGYEFRYQVMTCSSYGSTGVYSNARDLAKFMQQYRCPTLVSQETLDSIAFRLPQVKTGTTVTGGGARVSLLEGHRYIHHGGVKAGFRAIGMIFPEDDLTITITANTHNIPVETAARDVARVVLGLPGRALKNLDAYKKETVDLEKVPGFYRSESGNYCQLACKDGQVFCDGEPMQHVEGNLYKQGRLDCTLALGEPLAMLQNNGLSELKRFENPVPQALARQCEGWYFSDDIQALWNISYDGENLWWEHVRQGKKALRHLEGETFFSGQWTLTMTRNAEGQVNGYRCDGGKLKNMVFRKVK